MELKLYEIAPEFAYLVEQDELTPEDEQRLTDLGHAIEVKAGNIAAITDKLETFVDLCKAEEQRISNRRKAVENRIKWVNNYLQNNMETAGVYEIEIGTRKIALQKNPPKLVIDDETAVPAKFIIVIPESYQIDKNAIKAAMKKEEVPGCHLEQGYSLRKK